MGRPSRDDERTVTTPRPMTQRSAPARCRPRGGACGAFSLVELVIVVVILGIIGAIAVPRMGERVARSRQTALITSTRRVQETIDRYTAEHEGRCPAHDKTGAVDLVGGNLVLRLTGFSTIEGNPDGNGIYGPYLTRWPTNPINGLDAVRINGAAAGANTHGWHYAVDKQLFLPDDSEISSEVFDLDTGKIIKNFSLK